MISYDIHVHTHFSDCAARDAHIDDYVPEAHRLGIELIGFADHAWDSSVKGASPWYGKQDFDRLTARKKEYTSMLPVRVLFGAESEYAGGVLALTERGRALTDYVIVPHSHTHMRGLVIPEGDAADPKRHAEYLANSFVSLCGHRDRGLFFGIAHPMYPVGKSYEQIEEIYSYITDDMLAECAKAAKSSDVLLEFNLSCCASARGKNGTSCYKRFFDISREAGNSFFMGSDAHSPREFIALHAQRDGLVKEYGLSETDFTAAKLRIQSE